MKKSMGMFDNIIVAAEILPDLSQEEVTVLNQVGGWQSKDFENILTDVYIVEDKELKYKHSFIGTTFPYKLQIKKSERVEEPMNQRLHSDVSPIIALAGSIRETNIRIVDLDYTGSFIFYTFIRENLSDAAKLTKWYEFKGQAENGKIKLIERVFRFQVQFE